MAYPINATFIDEITYDIVPQHWTDEDWKKDLDSMKEVGIDTVVIMRSVFYDKILYPSKYFKDKKSDYKDFLKLILEEAEKRNMDVYVGLYISNLCWNDGDYEGEIEANKHFLEEFMPRYSSYKSFKGWYIPHETGHDSYNIKETLLGLLPMLKALTPDKKIFISPFFRSPSLYPDYPPRLSPEQTYEVWDDIFKETGKYIDICAFQDGTCLLNELDGYMNAAKRICDKYGIELWNNIETFERDENSTFPPIDFDKFVKKVEIASKYVTKTITFEFSHFLSPNSIYEKAHKNNEAYKKYYGNK